MLKFVKSISLFFVLLCIFAIFVMILIQEDVTDNLGDMSVQNNDEQAISDFQETVENIAVIDANIQPSKAKYRMMLKNSDLVVYILPTEDIYMSTKIDSDSFSKEEMFLLEQGIEFTDDEELFDYLESITS